MSSSPSEQKIIPTYTTSALDQIYSPAALADQTSRWRNLRKKFQDLYGQQPDFVARSPGRVNLIGEHIDYSLYEVLPMAITADTLVAVAVFKDELEVKDQKIRRAIAAKINISNIDENRFPVGRFEIPLNEGQSQKEDRDLSDDKDIISIDASAHDWTNYFKAGFNGAMRLIAKRQRNPRKIEKQIEPFCPPGMNVLVDGQVPTGAGLSSSAALVCSSLITVLKAHGVEDIDKKELVELAIIAERAVGVNAGGFALSMDQAASVLSEIGSALYVSFVPKLHALPVKIPQTDPEIVFLAAQSYVQADKQATAPIHYNLRVVECTLAAECLAKIFRLERPLKPDSSPLAISLRSFHDAYFCQKEGVKNENTDTLVEDFRLQLDKLIHMTDEYLMQEDGYTLEEISQILGESESDLRSKYMEKVPVRAERFMLRQRALHVFTEARRVIDFMTLLSSPPVRQDTKTDTKDSTNIKNNEPDKENNNNTAHNGKADYSTYLRRLGALMNETQDSCRDVYDCSAPELDELCRLALSAGACGSRLTGAGWGGCSVHLVPADKVDAVMEKWREGYYNKKFAEMGKDVDLDLDKEGTVVKSRPGSGSCIVVIDD